MAAGKSRESLHHSPIIDAIAVGEAGTTGEIRVHLSKRFFEKSPLKRARRLFAQFGLSGTSQHGAVLLYVNLRRRKFAVVGDQGMQKAVGPKFWESLTLDLRRNLKETHPERAIAMAVFTIGKQLKKHFPVQGKRK